MRNATLAAALLTGTSISLLGAKRVRRREGRETSDPIRFILNNAVAFVWGPPGTGKTKTLARITVELWSKGEQVLVLSHSNVAIDEAVARIAGRANSFREGRLVRYGFAQLKFLTEHRKLTSFYLATRLRPEIMGAYEKLLAERERLKRDGVQISWRG
ncbi:MAG: AAA domain-containing protein [Moorellaceae bacterium]